jgi:ATP/maltotriose-dependent transcriptional regulator MalT
MVTDRLAPAREAFARQDWKGAYAALSVADAADPQIGVEDVERLAISAYMLGKDEASAELWARAHTEWLRLRDVRRAARCIFWLVLDLLTRGEAARAGGWLARAQRLLDEQPEGCAEQGLLLALIARTHIRQGDVESAYQAASQAIELARCYDDVELQVFSRLSLGQVMARRGDRGAAAALFDEIMVAALVGDVSPIGVGVAYCAVIDGCFSLLDFERAREWTEALSGWCAAQPDLVAFRGKCVVHRTELLRLNGAWSQAMAEAERACEWLTEAVANPKDTQGSTFKYPVGAAFYQLGEIHRLHGAFEHADAAYHRASEYGHTPEPGLPLLRLAQGQRAAAAAAIRRILGEPHAPPKRAPVLAACVEIMIEVSALDLARSAADELAALAARYGARYLSALTAHASGSVLLTEGDAPAALRALRQAWMDWQEIEAPWEAARVRVLLGRTCRALGDEEAAHLEFEAAERVFERLGAAPDLAHVQSLRAPSTRPGDGMLTVREREVLALIATGMTNRAIADVLGISDRTVDRHVSNILSKLDLPTRAAATAYAYERGLVKQRT